MPAPDSEATDPITNGAPVAAEEPPAGVEAEPLFDGEVAPVVGLLVLLELLHAAASNATPANPTPSRHRQE